MRQIKKMTAKQLYDLAPWDAIEAGRIRVYVQNDCYQGHRRRRVRKIVGGWFKYEPFDYCGLVSFFNYASGDWCPMMETAKLWLVTDN